MPHADVAIHVVTPASADLLDSVDDDVFDEAVRPELLRAFLANPSNVLVVAVIAGQVVGMASGMAYVHPDKPLSLFVNEVGVSSRFHRQGIGAKLMEAILDWGRRQGCREAWVATEADNAPARGLYATCGGIEDTRPAVVYVFPLNQEFDRRDQIFND